MPFQLSVITARLFQNILGDAGFQVPEWRILMTLPAHQPCSSNDLCVLTAMDAARVSRAQRRLEDLGLITVIRDAADRRRLIVQLTTVGQVECDRLLDAAQQVERDFLARLGPEDRATLQSAIGGLFRRG